MGNERGNSYTVSSKTITLPATLLTIPSLSTLFIRVILLALSSISLSLAYLTERERERERERESEIIYTYTFHYTHTTHPFIALEYLPIRPFLELSIIQSRVLDYHSTPLCPCVQIHGSHCSRYVIWCAVASPHSERDSFRSLLAWWTSRVKMSVDGLWLWGGKKSTRILGLFWRTSRVTNYDTFICGLRSHWQSYCTKKMALERIYDIMQIVRTKFSLNWWLYFFQNFYNETKNWCSENIWKNV